MPNLFYYLYRWCLMMWTMRMKMARGGTRGKSWGSFMRECITDILGPGTAGYRCPFCNPKLHDAYLSVLAHARGRVFGSFKKKYSRRVAHGAYAEYLEKLQDRADMWDEMWDGSNYVRLSMLNDGWTMYLWLNYAYVRVRLLSMSEYVKYFVKFW